MLIIPGMVASVDILTGKKTILSYLLKPIIRARAEALKNVNGSAPPVIAPGRTRL